MSTWLEISLLANMTILFLPPAVGIMEKFDVIALIFYPSS